MHCISIGLLLISNLASMSDQLCENTAFQQWMTDHGSPGDLKGYVEFCQFLINCNMGASWCLNSV